jgi:transposase InsO family protein
MIKLLRKDVPIVFLCSHFEVSKSGFYSWLHRDQEVKIKERETKRDQVVEAFKKFKNRYGSPRICISLNNDGVQISENTVAKIMKKEGLAARKKKAFKVVCMDDKISDEVHERLFKIEDNKSLEVNEVWAGDITYIPVDNKFLYLSIVMDLKRRKILGCSIDDTLGAEGVITAFKNACKAEGKTGEIFHSDQGAQYKALDFKNLLIKKGVKGSMSRKGNCYDNSIVESFFKTFKSELLWAQSFKNEKDLRSQILNYIDVFYNQERIHSSLDYKSPLEYELTIKAS